MQGRTAPATVHVMTLPDTADSRAATPHLLAGPVVVGFDGSPPSCDALVLGRQLADLFGGALVVAVVQPMDLYVVPDPVLVADLDAQQYTEADALVAQAAEELGRAEHCGWHRSVVAARSPALGLQRVVEHEQAGIVVLGRTHRTGVARTMLGTTANRLLHSSSRLVAVAPPGWRAREREPRRIAAGFDGSDESRAALSVGAELASRVGTTLEAVAVFERPTPADPTYAMTKYGYGEQIAELRASLEHHSANALVKLPSQRHARMLVLGGTAPETLAGHAAAMDVLVVGSRAHGPLLSALTGDVAAKLAAHAPCALIVVPRGAGPHA